MPWKDPADFRSYSNKKLDNFLREFPTHLHRPAAVFEYERRQTKRRYRWTIGLTCLGLILCFVFGVLPYLLNKQPAKPMNLVAKASPSTTSQASTTPSATKPLNLAEGVLPSATQASATPKQEQSLPLPPSQTPRK